MNVLDRLDQMIDEQHLLKHPFYTKWAEGTLPIEALQEYARQYYAFESAMPRYLSALHTRTADTRRSSADPRQPVGRGARQGQPRRAVAALRRGHRRVARGRPVGHAQ